MDQARLLQLLFGSLSLPKANSIGKYRGANEKVRPRLIFLSSAHTYPPPHLSIIGGDFVLESVARYIALVHYSEFGGCPLFGSRKCTASTGIAVGTSTVARYSEEVRYWEGPLSEVPLYMHSLIYLEIWFSTTNLYCINMCKFTDTDTSYFYSHISNAMN